MPDEIVDNSGPIYIDPNSERMIGDEIDHTNPMLWRTERETIDDNLWLKNTFILNNSSVGKYNQWLLQNRFFTTADIKTTSTSPGMASAMNPYSQPCRLTDIRRPGLIKSRDVSNTRITGVPSYSVLTPGHPQGLGLGRYYSEAIDDNQQRIYLRFGSPQYMGMFLWVGKSFDLSTAILYKQGIISALLAGAIQMTSHFFAVAAHPIIYASKLLIEFLIKPDQFVSVKDNMYTYWTMVDTMLNSFYVRRTGAPFSPLQTGVGFDTTIGKPMKIDPKFVQGLNNLIPGIVNPSNGRISIWTIALRSQAANNRMFMQKLKDPNRGNVTQDPANFRLDAPDRSEMYTPVFGDPTRFTEWMLEMASWTLADPTGEYASDSLTGDWFTDIKDVFGNIGRGFNSMLESEADIAYGVSTNLRATKEGTTDELHVPPGSNVESQQGNVIEQENYATSGKRNQLYSWGEYFLSTVSGGAQFAVLNVEATGAVSESFSNSSGTNPLETLWNSIASKIKSVHEASASFMSIPVLGTALQQGFNATAAIISGASMGALDPLLALAYGTTVSLPKHWDSSSASLPRANYRIRLVSVYGNAYSQLFKIYLPLSMILCGSLPRATGINTHTAPFMCELLDPGRVNIPLGMFENVSITRGTSNLAFSKAGHPNAIDVEFSIVDLNQVLAVDLNGTGLLTRAMKAAKPDFGNRAIDNYINTVVGLSVFDMVYPPAQYRLRLAEQTSTWSTLFSDENVGAMLGSLPPILGRIGQLTIGSTDARQQGQR